MASEVCVASFPGVMEIDEATQVAAPKDEAGPLSEGEAEELVSLCPTGALRLERL